MTVEIYENQLNGLTDNVRTLISGLIPNRLDSAHIAKDAEYVTDVVPEYDRMYDEFREYGNSSNMLIESVYTRDGDTESYTNIFANYQNTNDGNGLFRVTLSFYVDDNETVKKLRDIRQQNLKLHQEIEKASVVESQNHILRQELLQQKAEIERQLAEL